MNVKIWKKKIQSLLEKTKQKLEEKHEMNKKLKQATKTRPFKNINLNMLPTYTR